MHGRKNNSHNKYSGLLRDHFCTKTIEFSIYFKMHIYVQRHFAANVQFAYDSREIEIFISV